MYGCSFEIFADEQSQPLSKEPLDFWLALSQYFTGRHIINGIIEAESITKPQEHFEG
jgi:hypothetical protein